MPGLRRAWWLASSTDSSHTDASPRRQPSAVPIRPRVRNGAQASRGSFSFDHLGAELAVVATSAAKGDIAALVKAVRKYVR